jgi:oligopeptide/dipeptide ABC transporter ATP-binding protein
MSADSAMPANAHTLAVRGLSISFGEGLHAVNGIDLTAHAGETVAIVGESGCGKTVTALALAGLLPVGARATGSAILDDTQLIGRSEREMRSIRGSRVGVIFQDASTALNPLMTIGDQIEEVMTIHTKMRKAARRAAVIGLLESVGVPDAPARSRSYPHELSGGMRQRVMIAIALAGNPELIIADEPTTALDVTVQAQVLALLRESTRESIVLFITHDMGVVAEIAQSVVVMYAGVVAESGPLANILDHPQHPYTAALLASVPDPDNPRVGELPTIPGRVPPIGERDGGCPFRDRCPKRTEICETMPNLAAAGEPGTLVACWHPESESSPVSDTERTAA